MKIVAGTKSRHVSYRTERTLSLADRDPKYYEIQKKRFFFFFEVLETKWIIAVISFLWFWIPVFYFFSDLILILGIIFSVFIPIFTFPIIVSILNIDFVLFRFKFFYNFDFDTELLSVFKIGFKSCFCILPHVF